MNGCSLHRIGLALAALGAFAFGPAAAASPPRPEGRPAGLAGLTVAAAAGRLRSCPLRPGAAGTTVAALELERVPERGAPAGWRAANPRHGFQTEFFADRVVMTPAHRGPQPWRIGLALVGFGCEGQVEPVGAASLEVVGSRASYRRPGLEEWYVNDVRGLEQGFTVTAPPPRRAGGPATMVLRVAVSGTSSQVTCPRAGTVRFTSPQGDRVLDYGQLEAVDADGQPLKAWLALAGRLLELNVDIAGARFPVVVDPLANSPNWAVSSEQGAAYLGLAVASAGDVNGDGFDDVIVGAPFFDDECCDEGRVMVFYGSAEGLAPSPGWAFSGGQECAYCGYAVAGAGDVDGDGYDDVIVGSSQYEGGTAGQGRVWVFRGAAAGLEATPAWTADGDQAGGCFGAAVGGAGDVNGDGYDDVIVGASDQDGDTAAAGRACVFHGGSGGLGERPAWCVRGTQRRERCGGAVAGAGDVNGDGYDDVIVGSPAHDGNETNGGIARVYLGGAGGLDTEPAWSMEGEQRAASFGNAVASAGDVNNDGFADVLVGACGFCDGGADRGRAWLYLGGANGLTRQAVWVADGTQDGGRFGRTLAAAGDVNGDGYGDVVIGASGAGEGSGGGRVYVYFGSYAGLRPAAGWTSAGLQNDGGFGWSVAGAGDVDGDGRGDVLVGAPLCDGEATDEGRVAVFYGGEIDMATRTGWVVESDQVYARMGVALGAAGDVDQNGFDDVLVAAPWYDEASVDCGRVSVYAGGAGGLAVAPAWVVRGPREGTALGFAASRAGDVNGDGYADIVVGAPNHDPGATAPGQAFLFTGGPDGLRAAPTWSVRGEPGESGFGFAVAGAGDVNSDGFADVVVGAPCLGGPHCRKGRALVFLGGRSGPSPVPAVELRAPEAGDGFGFAVALAGDVDGDGDAEILVGAPFAGKAHLYAGSSGALSGTTPAWTAAGAAAGDCFGWALAGAGDVNGDSLADVVIGAPALFADGEGVGAAFVFLGHAGGLDREPGWVATGDQEGMEFGRAVGAAGDVDGDGHTDVLVGAPGYDGNDVDEGRAFLFRGGPGGLAERPAWSADGGQRGAAFGSAVAGAGDVDHDGFSDYLVGAPTHHGGSVAEGRAYGYYGGVPAP